MARNEGKSCDLHSVRKYSFYLLLLFLAFLTCVDLSKLIRQYMNDNTDTSMFVVFNDTMTMPNVTFCMSKAHAWSFFNLTMESMSAAAIDKAVEEGFAKMKDKKSFLASPWDYHMVVEAYLMIQAMNSLERETSSEGTIRSIYNFALNPRMAGMRAMQTKWLNAIQERDVSFEELQQKVGVECLKMSMKRFQRLSASEDGRQIRNGYRITWISQYQMCFQPFFDRDNFKDIEDQDQFFALEIAHNVETLEGKNLDCLSVDFHGRPSMEARALEGKGRAKDGLIDGELCLGELHEVEAEVRAIYTMLPDAEEEHEKCHNYQQGDPTEFDCRSRCRLELIRKVCNCTGGNLAYLANEPQELQRFPLCDYSNCKIDPDNFNLSKWDETCGKKCYPDCTQVRYHLNHFKRKGPRSDRTQVTLLWGSFEYLRLIQKEKWSISKFVSNLGGSLGVWLGLSVLTVIQFITFLLTRAHKRVMHKGSSAENNGAQAKTRKISDNPLGGGISMNPLGNQFGAKNKRH